MNIEPTNKITSKTIMALMYAGKTASAISPMVRVALTPI